VVADRDAHPSEKLSVLSGEADEALAMWRSGFARQFGDHVELRARNTDQWLWAHCVLRPSMPDKAGGEPFDSDAIDTLRACQCRAYPVAEIGVGNDLRQNEPWDGEAFA
jgi:hypothetical protein